MKNSNLGHLQFYYRNTNKPNLPINIVPDFVEFEYGFIEDLQLIIQNRKETTLSYLDTIYKESFNVGYLQEGHDLASKYGLDFIDYIVKSINNSSPNANRISEIGAGGCYILRKLKELGYEVVAIDPSPIAHDKGKEFGIEIVPEFYPSSNFIPKSDVIIHYDVLEHIDNRSEFLKSNLNELNDNGLVIFAVPDCTDNIKTGDISMFIHQHLNYFDQDSLSNLMESEGFELIDICKSKYGGVLYCCARKSLNQKIIKKEGNKKLLNFQELSIKNISKVREFASEALLEGNTLGCYIPLRSLAYLSTIGIKENIRFFDDDKGIYNKYFDGFSIPIENREDLLNNPVTHLLIMSSAFGEKIKQEIVEILPNIKILTYNQVVEKNESI
jgi:SAM-dependent methyltransferase